MADVHEGDRAADYAGDLLQLHHADHAGVPEFTGPYVITGGGPTYSTYLFSLYIYDTAFKYFDMGYGAALAWILFWWWPSSPVSPLSRRNTGCSTPPIKEAKWLIFNNSPRQEASPNAKWPARCAEKINASVRYVILLVVGLLMLYPLVWMFSASFKPNHEIFTTLSLWPAHATWDGFVNGWKTGTEYNFGHYMLNTFKYVIPKVILTIISSTIVAYGFARFEIPWKKFWFATLITTMLLPSTVLLILSTSCSVKWACSTAICRCTCRWPSPLRVLRLHADPVPARRPA